MSKQQINIDIIETTDITLATSLLCYEDVVLMGTEACGEDREGRPLCQFTLGHPSPGYLDSLVKRHQQEPDGLMVGSRRYDLKKGTLVVPEIHRIRGQHPRGR